MGAIRGILLVFVSVFLLLSLLSMTFLGILSSSLDYPIVEKESSVIIEEFLQDSNIVSQIEKTYPLIYLFCQNNSEYVFTVEDYTINIPCSAALLGNEVILKEGIKNVIHQLYYKEFDCDFFDCIKSTEAPIFLLSEKSHNFLVSKFYFFLLISLVLLLLSFFLIEKKTNLPILTGILLIISSLLFIKIDILFSSISNEMFFKFLKIFFSQSFSVALKILILGIVFIILGIVFKIFKVGFFVSNLISKIRNKPTIEEKPQTKTIPEINKSIKLSKNKSK